MHRCFIQRPTRRVICARLRPVTFTRNRRTIPFCPLFSFRYCWLFSVPSMKPYVPSLPSVEKQTFRFPSTNSFISDKLNRSKFCMVMFIYPQHAPASGAFAHRCFQAHRPLEIDLHFRLILYWTILGLPIPSVWDYNGAVSGGGARKRGSSLRGRRPRWP